MSNAACYEFVPSPAAQHLLWGTLRALPAFSAGHFSRVFRAATGIRTPDLCFTKAHGYGRFTGVFGLFLLVCTVFVLSGCSERPRCTAYHFHRTYPAAYQASAREAAAKWSAFSGTPLTIEDGDPDDATCALGSVSDSSTSEYQGIKAEIHEDFFAAHMENRGSIWLAEGMWSMDHDSDGREADFATSVLMHEMAHEYGLQHIENAPDAVMGVERPGTNLEFGCKDREELARVSR